MGTARHTSDTLYLDAIGSRVDAHGVYCLQGESITEAIRRACGSKGAAVSRVVFGPGTWFLPSGGITLSRDNVQLVSSSPGFTTFKRSVATGAGISIEGQKCRIQGISFEDIGNSIEVTGDYSEVIDCRFSGTATAVLVSSADYVRVTNNLIIANTTPDAIELAGSSSYCEVSGNIIV